MSTKCTELAKLNEMLKEKDLGLSLFVAGGYYMQLLGLRNTENDIDACWVHTFEKDRIINEFNKTSPLDINCEIDTINDLVYKFNNGVYYKFESMSNLDIYVPYEDYFLIMKVIAASMAGDRDMNKHIKDSYLIARHLGIKDNFYDIYDIFRKYHQDTFGIEPIIKFLQEKYGNDN